MLGKTGMHPLEQIEPASRKHARFAADIQMLSFGSDIIPMWNPAIDQLSSELSRVHSLCPLAPLPPDERSIQKKKQNLSSHLISPLALAPTKLSRQHLLACRTASVLSLPSAPPYTTPCPGSSTVWPPLYAREVCRSGPLIFNMYLCICVCLQLQAAFG